MPATERQRSEQNFHDRQARERAADFELHPEKYCFEDDAYLDHETWIRPAFAALGEVAGKRVLDLGCGHAMAAVVLARRGGQVTAFDLSWGYVEEARNRARVNGVNLNLLRADGERLPFADGSFDGVWGHAVLHHLDVEKAGREVLRVLRPGGVAVFCEPWGENPLLGWARGRLPYRKDGHTPDEQPLRRRHVGLLRGIFPLVEVRGFQLLSMARRFLPAGRLSAGLDWCDDMLLARVPALERYCRYVVLTLGSAEYNIARTK